MCRSSCSPLPAVLVFLLLAPIAAHPACEDAGDPSPGGALDGVGAGDGVATPDGGESCIPSCAGRACGDDGCNGSCGTCGEGGFCSGASVCLVSGATVAVAAGPFMRGCYTILDNECNNDESPREEITLSAFSIDQTEVTVAAYAACVDAGGCTAPGTDPGSEWKCNWGAAGRDNHPINCVNWYQAEAYCAWAGKRLPTEAEWEKAARGTDSRTFPWGSEAATCELANVDIGVGGCHGEGGETIAVGSYPAAASPYGALDMAGNVYEWVSDWYGIQYYNTAPKTDPQGPPMPSSEWTDPYRVLRGGSWEHEPREARTSNRVGGLRTDADSSVGFRCAQSESTTE